MLVFVTLVILAVSWHKGESKTYCLKDQDCAYLGNLRCIKSFCQFGICGCPRGQAARFLGSSRFYSCLPLRKIGGKCSDDGTKGLCAAYKSVCSDGYCRCQPGFTPQWNGERCGFEYETGVGDTCAGGRSTGQLGNCELDATSCERFDKSSSDSKSNGYSGVMGDVPVCACKNNQKIEIVKDYAFTYSTLLGSTRPVCSNLKIGDTCIQNTDCPGYSGYTQCKNHICMCKYGYSPNYAKTACIIKRILVGMGYKCSSSSVECDGSKGLVCGDACNPSLPWSEKRCGCGPHFTRSGYTCIPKTVGSPCYGDENCANIGPLAGCVNSTCVAKVDPVGLGA